MGVSKAKSKLINSLHLKKFRNEYGLFVAEGRKLIGELLPHFHCRLLLRTEEPFENEATSFPNEVVVIDSPDELKGVSKLTTPPSALALFEIPQREFSKESLSTSLTLMLDDVQDPGNLGTIIRTANWFGINQIICSHGCADVFSNKVVQATMGALAHVNICYTDLIPILEYCASDNIAIYGTMLNGKNIYETPLNNGIIVMGNEGNGISDEVAQFVNNALLIPSFSTDNVTESLNVAIATAITCAEFRRRGI